MGGRRRRRSRASREDEWIEWIRKQVGPAPSQRFPLGIGDDAALWRPPPRSDVVLTVDCQAAGTHFERGWLKPRELGFRAVSSSVSDLAAMAARPGALLVSLLIDERLRPSGFRELYRGICEASSMYSMPVVGGNVARGPLSVTVTALGSVERRGAWVRGDDWAWLCSWVFPDLPLVRYRIARRPPGPLRARTVSHCCAFSVYRLPDRRSLSSYWDPDVNSRLFRDTAGRD